MPRQSKMNKMMESSEGVQVEPSPFDWLPAEILQKILGKLPFNDRIRAERVCKRWRNALIGTVWKDVRGLVIIEREYGISYHQVQGTWDRFGDMIDFEENQLVIFTDQLRTIEGMVRRIADHLNTVILIIDHTRTLIAPLLAIFANHCSKIQRLAATRVGPSAGPEFRRLLTCNTQLRSINCADARHIIEILSEISRDWISLELWYCNAVHDINCATKLQQILQQSPSIEKLRLESLTEEMMLTIVACNQLKSLTLPLWIENTICALANRSMLKRLTDLDLRYFVSDDDLLVHLLSNCINLRSIGLHSLFGNYYN